MEKNMNMEIFFPGNKRVNAAFNGFTVMTDQPKDNEGDNSAPEPFALFFASIGTCAGFYVLSFFNKRNIPIMGLKLNLRTERNPETMMINKVLIDISLPSSFPEKYKEAVIRSAEFCTVKKHIDKPPIFEINAQIIQ
jgi:ribosomal protein S12 methylthiotransferase accessory factor